MINYNLPLDNEPEVMRFDLKSDIINFYKLKQAYENFVTSDAPLISKYDKLIELKKKKIEFHIKTVIYKQLCDILGAKEFDNYLDNLLTGCSKKESASGMEKIEKYTIGGMISQKSLDALIKVSKYFNLNTGNIKQSLIDDLKDLSEYLFASKMIMLDEGLNTIKEINALKNHKNNTNDLTKEGLDKKLKLLDQSLKYSGQSIKGRFKDAKNTKDKISFNLIKIGLLQNVESLINELVDIHSIEFNKRDYFSEYSNKILKLIGLV